MIKAIKSVFGFLTILPVGMDTERAARNVWLFPLVGAFIALLAAILYDGLSYVFSDTVTAALALFLLLALTGFHHLDGLLDFGDALMCVGSADARKKAMRDVNTGVGGFAFGFFVLLISYAAIIETTFMYSALIVAEASAKFSMALAAFVGRPSHEGMGSVFTKAVNAKRFLPALIVYLLVLFILPPEQAVVVIITTIASSLLITAVSSRLLGGVSGDVFGAINEITRMLVLVVLLA